MALRNSFSSVVDQVSPAIVSIYTKVTIEANPAEIFGPFMFHEPKKIEREALGSGVIVTRRGLIVTNDHVIEKADKIKVITHDEQQYDAEVVMRDGLHDIAIIRIISEDEEDEVDDDDIEDEYDDNIDEGVEVVDNTDNTNNNNDEDDIDDDDDNELESSNSSNNTKNNSSRKSQSSSSNNNNNKSSSLRNKRNNRNRKNNRSSRSSSNNQKTIICIEDEIDKEPESVNGRSFPYLTMGTAESCRVGDYVLAIGNNLGFHGTVTDGIISAIGRTNDERLPIAYPQFPLIQTNASINPGSSGGALVNMNGQLIGINESIATSTGGNVGVGFAVPVNFIRPLLRSAMKKSFVYEIERVWDGISPVSCPIAILPKDTEDSLEGENKDKLRFTSHQKRGYPRGIRVKSIHKQSPAARAGIKKNDIILRINNVDIDNINTYYLLIAGADPNVSLKYDIRRETRVKRNKDRHTSNNRSRSRSRSRSPSGTNSSKGDNNSTKSTAIPAAKVFSSKSWVDFGDNIESHLISVRIELIPLPEKKPLEIKDRLNPFYGAQIVELCPAINSDFGLDFAQQGVAIWDVEPGSQAMKLGFKIGDIIISIDNQRLRTLQDIENIGDRLQTRKSCRIKFKRSGKINHVDVYLRTRRRYFSRM